MRKVAKENTLVKKQLMAQNTTLAKVTPLSQDHHRALGVGLL